VGYSIQAYYLILPFLKKASQMVNTRNNCNGQGNNTNN
jgi:hypothetical protein